MAELPAREWIVYGFSIIGYLFAFVVIGSVLSVFGLMMILSAVESGGTGAGMTDIFLGLIVSIFGSLTVIAGFAGALYKIVVDGVSRALEAHT